MQSSSIKKSIMLIKSFTALTSISEVQSKGISSLFFNSSATLGGTERITVYVESSRGNRYIFNDLALKDVLHLASFQDDSKLKVFSYAGVNYIIELTKNGGYIELQEGEQIRIKMSNLTGANTYNIHGIEAPYPSDELFCYEEKIFPVGEKIRDYDVRGYDLISVDQITDIDEITFLWDNGASTKMTKEEFQAVSSSLDEELFNNPPTASNIAVLPLLHVVSIQIVKPSANAIVIGFRLTESIKNLV